MVIKREEMKLERREPFAGGQGGGTLRHAIPPGTSIAGSRFRLVSEVTLDPGAEIGEHVHADNEEIYWVLSGSGLFRDDGREVPARPGDLILTRRGHTHGLRNTGGEPLVFLAVVAGKPAPE